MNIKDEILKYLSEEIRGVLQKLPDKILNIAEEIRIFSQRHIIIYTSTDVFYIDKSGDASKTPQNLYIPSNKSLEKTVLLMCNNSVYSEMDNIKSGFLTLPFGHRVGIVGTAVLSGDKISYIKDITCINIRITREIKGFSNKVLNHICQNGQIKNTLIISPPQCGKTTLLRDIARVLGSEYYNKKIGIVDERNEIASVVNGKIINDIGLHTFVINNCPKDVGVNILTRTMSPDIIITDEIGSENDVVTMKKALCSGVKLITSIHSGEYNEFLKSDYSKIVKDFFDVFIVLSRKNGPGTIEQIIKKGDNYDI